jgi:hypothetical protein
MLLRATVQLQQRTLQTPHMLRPACSPGKAAVPALAGPYSTVCCYYRQQGMQHASSMIQDATCIGCVATTEGDLVVDFYTFFYFLHFSLKLKRKTSN